MAATNQFPNRPPRMPPPPTLPPTQLVALTPSPRAHTLVVLLLGVEGPQEIIKKDRTKTLLATLYLADDTLPTGVELRIWGRQALQIANLRIMDLLHINKAVVVTDRFRGIVLKFRGDATVARVGNGMYAEVVQRLVVWRRQKYNELLGFAEKGRLRSRDWVSGTGAKTGRTAEEGTIGAVAENGGMGEVDFVHVTSVRIRVARRGEWNELDGIRALCRRICIRCDKRLSEDVCRCGCRDWKWGFGWLVLGLRDGSGEFMVTVEGDVIGRLLFGVEVQRVVEDDAVARACCSVLESLVRDGGVFRVVVEARGVGRLRLLHLFV